MLPILADAEIEPSIIVGLVIIIEVIAVLSFIFFLRRLRHKEIMAAIEKGISLPTKPTTPKGPRWITNISVGIGFLIVSLTFLGLLLGTYIHKKELDEGMLVPPGIFLAIGAAFLIRGLLQRKIQ
jgi:hypothetical protein